MFFVLFVGPFLLNFSPPPPSLPNTFLGDTRVWFEREKSRLVSVHKGALTVIYLCHFFLFLPSPFFSANFLSLVFSFSALSLLFLLLLLLLLVVLAVCFWLFQLAIGHFALFPKLYKSEGAVGHPIAFGGWVGGGGGGAPLRQATNMSQKDSVWLSCWLSGAQYAS